MRFLEEEELIRYVSEGIAMIGGEKAHRTFHRLWQEMKNTHPVLAIDRAVDFAFDRAGHVLMNHVGRKIARDALKENKPMPLEVGRLSLQIRECPVYGLSSELKPTESIICSLCRGYMEAIGNVFGVGPLKEVQHIDGSCEFVYGGEGDGPDRLQPEGVRAEGDIK